jgi:glycosyltransferase involved in cell wall biosynthesis
LRVLHLINHCRFGHGNVHAAVDLACAQAEMGDNVAIACGPGEFAALLGQNGVEHVLLDQESRKPRQLISMTKALGRLIAQRRPDVVHAHMMTGAALGWATTRLPHVPFVTTVHNAFERHAILMALGDRVIGVSEAVTQNMARRGVSRLKLRTVLNGTLGAPRRDYFARVPTPLERPSVATICGLHDRKGVRDLLAAFELVAEASPQAHLYIAGDGPERSTYEAIAAGLAASRRIHFLGSVTDTKSILDNVDIFVLASHADPAPLVIPEAREAGCAIVATNVDGIPELLDGGKAGLLVPPGNPVALGRAIESLLTNPQALLAAKARARDRVDYWSVRRVAIDTRAVYGELTHMP